MNTISVIRLILKIVSIPFFAVIIFVLTGCEDGVERGEAVSAHLWVELAYKANSGLPTFLDEVETFKTRIFWTTDYSRQDSVLNYESPMCEFSSCTIDSIFWDETYLEDGVDARKYYIDEFWPKIYREFLKWTKKGINRDGRDCPAIHLLTAEYLYEHNVGDVDHPTWNPTIFGDTYSVSPCVFSDSFPAGIIYLKLIQDYVEKTNDWINGWPEAYKTYLDIMQFVKWTAYHELAHQIGIPWEPGWGHDDDTLCVMNQTFFAIIAKEQIVYYNDYAYAKHIIERMTKNPLFICSECIAHKKCIPDHFKYSECLP